MVLVNRKIRTSSLKCWTNKLQELTKIQPLFYNLLMFRQPPLSLWKRCLFATRCRHGGQRTVCHRYEEFVGPLVSVHRLVLFFDVTFAVATSGGEQKSLKWRQQRLPKCQQISQYNLYSDKFIWLLYHYL